jgi:hypothetical protein
MKISYFHLFFLLVSSSLFSQNWAGTWSGEVTQDGKPDTFIYTIEMEQEGPKLFGTSTSKNVNGGGDAQFEIGGVYDGETMTLQEVKQLEPPNAKWCLKHIRFTTSAADDSDILEGKWEAQGCTPGSIVLRRQMIKGIEEEQEIETDFSQNSTSDIPGKYTGTLSQSDREYGFFFEIHLAEDGTGTSNIISDGEGGNALHQLKWTFDEAKSEIYLTEKKVLEKSVADWPWCIKRAALFYQKDKNRLSLTGNWEGFIEGYDSKSGACAPGHLYVERPIFKNEEIVSVKNTAGENTRMTEPQGIQQYKKQEKRDVSVDRVLEVKNNTVRVRVWDTGIVDGDILSLFVNGQMILENYRVSSRKHETIIKLDKPTNFLILHAINLGKISPNTVAVSVDDGIEEQVVIMSSNLDKSGAIMIRQFDVGN